MHIRSWMDSMEQGDWTPYAGAIRLGWKEQDEAGGTQLHTADHFALPECLIPVFSDVPKELDVIVVHL